MIQHPFLGVVEPEALDTTFIFNHCKPYLGQFICKDVTNDYKPLSDQFHDLVT
jgi:homospermidine synthase